MRRMRAGQAGRMSGACLPARATTMRASMKPRVVTRDSRCSSVGMKYVYPVIAPPGHADTCTPLRTREPGTGSPSLDALDATHTQQHSEQNEAAVCDQRSSIGAHAYMKKQDGTGTCALRC